MTEYQRLFLVQARADFAVFELLRGRTELPACHSLHYLQMATEMLGKAYAWKDGPPTKTTHRAFVTFLRSLSDNRYAQQQLGYGQQKGNWRNQIRKQLPLVRQIEYLAPALAMDGPNPEYPWPRSAPQIAPVEHAFDIFRELNHQNPPGREFLSIIGRLFDTADAFL